MPEGYLIIDHRNSPGIPEELARRSGLPPGAVREGGVLEMKTKRCRHCGGVVVLNPERFRARHTCVGCGGEFICDGCKAASLEPGYIHRSFEHLADAVRSGRYILGGSPSAPLLIPSSSQPSD